MKNYLIKIFTSVALLIASNAYCQSNMQEAQYKYGDAALDKFLKQKCSEAFKKNEVQVCLISVTFARFTIDTLGNIKELTFSENKDTPRVFRDILTSVVNATNGSWLPCKIDGKAVESKPFILPIIYAMEAGCSNKKITVNNGTATALLDILNYEGDNKTTKLDCILLSPLYVFSQN